MSQTRHHALRELLRAGDPLPAGDGLSDADANRMRRTVLAAASRRELWRPWRMALAAAALATLTAGAYLLGPRRDLRNEPGAVPAGGDPAAGVPAAGVPAAGVPVAVADLTEEPRGRQIQFTTRGGTRVIWVLRPSTR